MIVALSSELKEAETADLNADDLAVCIPASALSPVAFSAWSLSGAAPERGRFALLGGELFIDMNAQIIGTHGRVKLAVSQVIGVLVTERNLGEFHLDGTRLTHVEAEISNDPDACFVSWDSLQTGKVSLVRNSKDEEESLIGSPDWVLEVVSRSSVRKDTVVLRERYFLAGIREYWLIDARREKIKFEILVRGAAAYLPQPVVDGWQISPVFERRFSLVRQEVNGYWRFELLSEALPTAAQSGPKD